MEYGLSVAQPARGHDERPAFLQLLPFFLGQEGGDAVLGRGSLATALLHHGIEVGMARTIEDYVWSRRGEGIVEGRLELIQVDVKGGRLPLYINLAGCGELWTRFEEMLYLLPEYLHATILTPLHLHPYFLV